MPMARRHLPTDGDLGVPICLALRAASQLVPSCYTIVAVRSRGRGRIALYYVEPSTTTTSSGVLCCGDVVKTLDGRAQDVCVYLYLRSGDPDLGVGVEVWHVLLCTNSVRGLHHVSGV